MVERLIQIDAIDEVQSTSLDKATLETDEAIYTVEVMEGETEQVSEELQQFNLQWIEYERPEVFTTFADKHEIIHITDTLVAVEEEIGALQEQLDHSIPLKDGTAPQKGVKRERAETQREQAKTPSSIFDLASSTKKQQKTSPESRPHKKMRDQEGKERFSLFSPSTHKRTQTPVRSYKLRQDQGEGGGKEKEQHDQEKEDRRKKAKVEEISKKNGNATLYGIENVYVRFMALMARILGQSEAEAHNLYSKIKGRTDQIDLLTTFIQKINSSGGGIDWEEDEQMRSVVDQARKLGVDIPEGKYSWAEDEKILLKENIQMRKDSMEKVTQLERTDMQRYLQESSQCHQARSNILKLMKEVIDTFIYNMRP
ncbi:MAG: hypothetical protein S4CHLAM45_08880 [Chlamydiales bacterium]|nr:hypothetical protein [Chlamydiales bacterium]MCH9620362.1 hypothetical protein [Chlamydiales bacterium]MCH9622992.1 hypothetical protein [Chlamydiales bacterium]